ncbi:MAG: ATPase domain-containing protein [Nitrososphaera sp.]
MLVERDFEPDNDQLFGLLDDFLATSPCSLLIRGEPGQGKTTFVLEFMKRYRGKYRGYYVSTRVSLEKLEKQFGWITGLLKKETILEAEDSPKQELKGFDARIGRAKNLTEIVTNAALGDSALIVLDSWDTLAKETPFDERAKTERMITTIADAHNSLILFVGEEDEFSRNSAYLVDGIITLSSDTIDSVKIRRITIDKMRGTSIPRRDMLYSLENSRFEILPKLRVRDYPDPGKFEPAKLQSGFFSSGNLHLDSILGGGIRKGSVILIENSQETMRFSQDLILSGFILNVLATKNGALLVNAPDTPSKARIDLIRPYIQGELLKNLRIFSHEKVASDPTVIVLSDDEKENQERLTKEYENLRGLSKKGSGQVVVALDVGLNEIRRFEEADLWKSRLIDLARIIRENGDLLVLVNRTGLDTVPLPKTISDIHLQILNKSGIHFVRVQKPSIDGPTILFSLSADDRKRYPAYILKKVV